MLPDSLKDKLQEGVSSVSEKIDDAKESIKENIIGDEQAAIISEFKDSGTNKVREVFSDITSSNTLILKSGFELMNLDVSLGLPPEIGASFHLVKKISDEEKAVILKEVEDKKIVKIIITCLFKASEYFDKINLANYKLEQVELTLGLAPGIKIIFNKTN